MTFSLVALDRKSGAFGVAVATCHPAVGALVPYARPGVGAVATQASTNPHYGLDALDDLAAGFDPSYVACRLTDADRGRAHRQVHLIDKSGRAAAYTGAETVAWAGQRQVADVSVAGNMLAGPGVLDAMLDAYRAASGQGFATRLLAALTAGEAAGGDKRGRMSAALLVADTQRYPALDLRVDLSDDPLTDLAALLQAMERPDVRAFRATLPTRVDPGRSPADRPETQTGASE